MKMCAIYTRVSTDNQAEKEYNSCQSQEEKIQSFISSQEDWQVYRVYSDEGYTGANLERPAFKRMLNDIANIDIILFYKMDRLTRSPKDFYHLVEVFENSNTDFISITERFDTSTPSGRLLRNIMLTFGQFERELTSERVKDKMLERAKKGMWNGGGVPYGYDNKDKKLVVNKKESKIVKIIFDTFLETESLFETYQKLKSLKITDRTGRSFPKSAVFYILRNIVYTGKNKYSDIVYPGIHQAIISDEIFDLAQQYHNSKFLPKKVYGDYALAGVVKCNNCGTHMTPSSSFKTRKGKRTKYKYYRCTRTLKQDWDDCSVKQINSDRLENYVLENLKRISNDFSYIDNLIFRLNHSSETPHHTGVEQTAENAPFSAKFFQSRLKTFLKNNSSRVGVQKNLFIRKYIQDIIYSPKNILINFIYSDSADYSDESRRKLFCEKQPDFSGSNSALSFQNSGRDSDVNNSSVSKKGFAPLSLAAGEGFEPSQTAPEAVVLPLDDPAAMRIY